MLKKIATKDLKIGMFVADVGRSWINHPWKTKSKLIQNQTEIKELLDYHIDEVYIDLSKSKIPQVETAPSSNEDKVVSKVQTTIKNVPPLSPTPDPVSKVEEEMPKAAKAYAKALDTSKAVLAACRMNKKIEINMVKECVDELVDSVVRNRDALLALMKLKRFDDYTYTHSLNVSVLAVSTGRSLGLDEETLKVLGLGTMFHDVGKTKIPGYILNKPGKLTDDEFIVMRDHASLSARIIMDQKLNVPDLVLKVARHHHERSDGSGYPDHLKGDEIPPLVTICGLSDVYDALTSDRVYHKGRSPQEALKFIYSLRDTHFQGQWVDRFVQSVGIYPPGSVVELSTGQIAVVMEGNQEALNAPLLKIVADQKGLIYSRAKVFDLNKQGMGEQITIKRVIPKSEAGFEPGYYFNPAP